jgi:hypothetical protein
VFNHIKTIDTVLCCTIGVKADNLFNKLHVLVPNSVFIGKPPLWGNDRDNILFRSKILLNIHHKDKEYNILEEIRITRCIFNKIIVISEHSENEHLYPLHNYLIFCDYDKLADKAKEVVENYEEYYNKIYGNFNIDEPKALLQKFLTFE